MNTQSDSTQIMALFYFTTTMMVFVGTCGIASLPDFDSIDESLDFRNELAPKPSHPDCNACFTHHSCMDKLLANRMSIGMENKEIVSDDAKETKSIMDDHCMSIRGFEISWVIVSGLVLRLGTNNMNYDPATSIKTLVAKNGGSYKKFCTQAKTMQHALACLKEDFGPHKLVKQFLEELAKAKNYCLAIMQAVCKLRSHLRRHGDTQNKDFQCEGKALTLRSMNAMIKDHQMQDKFIIESSMPMTPTTKEAEIQESSDDELESNETFANGFKQRESCSAC